MSECPNCVVLEAKCERLQRRLDGALGMKDASKAVVISIKQKQKAAWYLGNNRCGCGKPKFPMSTTCPECWAKLDPQMQDQLKKVTRGLWVAAYMKAQEILGHRQTIKGVAVNEENARKHKAKEAEAAVATNATD